MLRTHLLAANPMNFVSGYPVDYPMPSYTQGLLLNHNQNHGGGGGNYDPNTNPYDYYDRGGGKYNPDHGMLGVNPVGGSPVGGNPMAAMNQGQQQPNFQVNQGMQPGFRPPAMGAPGMSPYGMGQSGGQQGLGQSQPQAQGSGNWGAPQQSIGYGQNNGMGSSPTYQQPMQQPRQYQPQQQQQQNYSGWNNPSQNSANPWNDPGRSHNPLDNLAALFNSGDKSQLGQLGSGIGSLLSLLGLGGGGDYNNPADAAMPYLDQVKGAMSPYYNPYINAGKQAMGVLQGEYGKLLGDPGGMVNKIGSSFHESPGFGFATTQATNAANRAAAAGGMLGSPAEQQALASAVTGLANQDYNNHLNHAIGMYGQGLKGEEGLNLLGFNASNEMAQSLAAALQSQAQLAYSGQANQNQYEGQNSGASSAMIGSAVSSLLPLLLGLL